MVVRRRTMPAQLIFQVFFSVAFPCCGTSSTGSLRSGSCGRMPEFRGGFAVERLDVRTVGHDKRGCYLYLLTAP
jgi:hypothetical protein